MFNFGNKGKKGKIFNGEKEGYFISLNNLYFLVMRHEKCILSKE